VVASGEPVPLGRAKTEQRKDAGSVDSFSYRRDRGRRDAKRLQPDERCRISRSGH
jgi:hypothetical protein